MGRHPAVEFGTRAGQVARSEQDEADCIFVARVFDGGAGQFMLLPGGPKLCPRDL